jgi:hypothetical protein
MAGPSDRGRAGGDGLIVRCAAELASDQVGEPRAAGSLAARVVDPADQVLADAGGDVNDRR